MNTACLWAVTSGNLRLTVRMPRNGSPRFTGLPAAVAAVVAARGIGVGEVDDFLYPKMQNLMPDPFCLKDMEKAALRIAGAVERGERGRRYRRL